VGNLMLGACVSSSGGRGIFEANRLLGRVERALVAELGGRSVFRGNVVNHAKIAMCALPHALALFEDNFVYNCAIGIDAGSIVFGSDRCRHCGDRDGAGAGSPHPSHVSWDSRGRSGAAPRS
jgi:hypothetical protein